MFDFLDDFLTDVENPDDFWSDGYGTYDEWGGGVYDAATDTADYGDISDWGSGNSTWGDGGSMFGDWGKIGKQALVGGTSALTMASGAGRSGGLASLASRTMGGAGGNRMPIQQMGDARGPQALTSKNPETLNSYWMDKMRDFARWKATVAASDPDVKIGRK